MSVFGLPSAPLVELPVVPVLFEPFEALSDTKHKTEHGDKGI